MKAYCRSTAPVTSSCGKLPTVGRVRNWSLTEFSPSFQLSSVLVNRSLALRVAAVKSVAEVICAPEVVGGRSVLTMSSSRGACQAVRDCDRGHRGDLGGLRVGIAWRYVA